MLKICLRSVNMKLVGVAAILSIFCLTTVMGAPRENLGEESLKQQIASGLLRGGNDDYWNAINQGLSRRPGGLGGMQKRFDSLSGDTFGLQKRNFDPIDNTGLGFYKRNFDQIDNTGLGFYKRSLQNTKRNFDEIDRTGFGSFVKRMFVL